MFSDITPALEVYNATVLHTVNAEYVTNVMTASCLQGDMKSGDQIVISEAIFSVKRGREAT